MVGPLEFARKFDLLAGKLQVLARAELQVGCITRDQAVRASGKPSPELPVLQPRSCMLVKVQGHCAQMLSCVNSRQHSDNSFSTDHGVALVA